MNTQCQGGSSRERGKLAENLRELVFFLKYSESITLKGVLTVLRRALASWQQNEQLWYSAL